MLPYYITICYNFCITSFLFCFCGIYVEISWNNTLLSFEDLNFSFFIIKIEAGLQWAYSSLVLGKQYGQVLGGTVFYFIL